MVQQLRLLSSNAGTWVQSLVEELWSHKPWGAAKNLESKQNMRLYLKYSRQGKKGGDGEDGIGNKNGENVTTKAGCSWGQRFLCNFSIYPVYILNK